MVRGLYSLERWTVFGVPLALASPLESQTVKTMAKHRDALEAALGVPVAFALEDATSYRIRRMLETGLPFVERGGQVYLPFLGIALRDGKARASNRQQADVVTFSPQAQRLALMALYSDLDGASVTRAAAFLGAAKMTASRAFDELTAADPSLVGTEGRRRLRPQRGDGENVDVVLGVVAAEGRGSCDDGGELWLGVSGRRVGRDLLA